MADKPVTQSLVAEEDLRDYVMVLLRKGYTMEQIIMALQAVKVEMACASRYQEAINDALYRP